MPSIAFYTLGCKVNQYETEVMREQFSAQGYQVVEFYQKADFYLINTCSVTAMADRKSRNIIRRAHKTNPEAKIIVAGCYSQVHPEELKKLEFVDLIIGNEEKKQVVALAENIRKEARVQVGNILYNHPYNEASVLAHAGKTRAFMKIQDGCDNFCAYCIIPYARGPVRSRGIKEIVREAAVLAAAGYQEIVLTGIHLTSYGKDLDDLDLYDVLLELHEVEGLERLRLGSLELTPVLFKIAEHSAKLPKLCPHFHISLQSGCDTVLVRMKRRYTSGEYQQAVRLLRDNWPDAAITTDIMAGFPGETEEEARQSFIFAKSLGFAKMHVFPYSIRPGTAAADMKGQLSEQVKKKRAAQLQELDKEMENAFYHSCVGKTMPVLFEQRGEDGLYEGHTPNYAVAAVESVADLHKQILPVKILHTREGRLLGEIAE